MSTPRKYFFALFSAVLIGLPIQKVTPTQAAPENATGAIEVILETGDYSVGVTADGNTLVEIADFTQVGEAGQTLLPQRVYYVALPPDVDPDSVGLQVMGYEQETLSGSYTLASATADLSSASIPAQTSTASRASSINQEPADSVSLLGSGQLRKWRFVRLSFSPVLYWPDTGRVDLVTSLTLHLNYDQALGGQDEASLADTVADDQARQLFANFDEAAAWYTLVGAEDTTSSGYNYVIITTDDIVANSSNLGVFSFRKQSMGYGVRIVTESDYGSLTGQDPDGTAEKIRQWLIDNYADYGIEYVLLIGDPDPDTGDVPMKMCYPSRGFSGYESYQESPTDYFYADLTGDWDLNGDGYFGVYGTDTATGGVDYAAEVYVGRIPVYDNNTTVLDAILKKIMDYEDEIGPVSWRQSALLPMSFSTTTYDGAPLAEQMKADYITAASLSTYTMYQQGSGTCSLNSSYTSDQELRGGTTVRTRWAANDYGLTVWWGHGSYLGAYVGDNGSCYDGNLFLNSYASYLDDDHPAFVFQNSCLNGYPEYSTNLQYAMLKNGAVATVGASRVSYFNTGVGYGSFDGSTTNSGIAYEYAQRIVAGDAAGDALYDAKGSMTPEYHTRLMNFTDFNLYGDPSVGINSYVSSSALPRPANNLKLQSVSASQVQLSWQDNSPNETGFYVQTSTDGESWELSATVDADVTVITDTQEAASAPLYRVAAYNAQGTSDYANPVGLFWFYLPAIVRQAD